MKRTLLLLGLVGMLLATAFAQDNLLRGSIPFEFVAGHQTLPAGEYEFRVTGDHFVRLVNAKSGKTAALLMPLTRISGTNLPDGKGRVSFDMKDGMHFIEAIWPSNADGYLIHAVKGQHSQDSVTLK